MGHHAKNCAVRIYETNSGSGATSFLMPCECGCGLSGCCAYITFDDVGGVVTLDFDNAFPSTFLECMNLPGATEEVYYIEIFLDGCPGTDYTGGSSDYTVGDLSGPLATPVGIPGAATETCVCLIFYDEAGQEMGRCSVDGTKVIDIF